jgi:hypothetical protein
MILMNPTSVPQVRRSITSLLIGFALLICSNCACTVAAEDSKRTKAPCHQDDTRTHNESSTPSSELSKCCTGQIASLEKQFYFQKDTSQQDSVLWCPFSSAHFQSELKPRVEGSNTRAELSTFAFDNRLFSISAPRGPPGLHT